jgi:hypothetical protein
VRAALQGGLWEWITVSAAIWADGKKSPPGLTYAAASGAPPLTWVADIKAEKHDMFITSTPSGWSNNDVGLAWLEQVFDCCTKQKAQRAYQLFIVDSHSSYITQDLIDCCFATWILLAMFPPHSTHSLQPLDVIVFKPLTSCYSHEVTTLLQCTQGLVVIKKGDFFPLFWKAWVSSLGMRLY